MSEAGWKPDPNGRHEWRYWDGATWTDQVSDAGQTATDAYDPSAIPPPPPVSPAEMAAATRPRSASYRLVLLDRKDREMFSAPFQSADMAIRHADENPALRMKHTFGSAMRKGAIHANIVPWKTALILEIDDETGGASEYHRMEKSVSRLSEFR
jgi:hypothetical protein